MKEIAQCAAGGGCDRNPLNQAAVPVSHRAAQVPVSGQLVEARKPRKVGGVSGPSRGGSVVMGDGW